MTGEEHIIGRDEYQALIKPLVKKCLCSSSKFQKIVSFNFEDYGIAPTMLWDAEFLIQKNIRERFEALGDWSNSSGESQRQYRCPACNRKCTEFYAQYSISMDRSYVLFEEDLRAPDAAYLTGFRCIADANLDAIKDFTRTLDREYYLRQFALPPTS